MVTEKKSNAKKPSHARSGFWNDEIEGIIIKDGKAQSYRTTESFKKALDKCKEEGYKMHDSAGLWGNPVVDMRKPMPNEPQAFGIGLAHDTSTGKWVLVQNKKVVSINREKQIFDTEEQAKASLEKHGFFPRASEAEGQKASKKGTKEAKPNRSAGKRRRLFRW